MWDTGAIDVENEAQRKFERKDTEMAPHHIV